MLLSSILLLLALWFLFQHSLPLLNNLIITLTSKKDFFLIIHIMVNLGAKIAQQTVERSLTSLSVLFVGAQNC